MLIVIVNHAKFDLYYRGGRWFGQRKQTVAHDTLHCIEGRVKDLRLCHCIVPFFFVDRQKVFGAHIQQRIVTKGLGRWSSSS